MQKTPEGRFVRISLGDGKGTVTLHAPAPGFMPEPANHPLLARIMKDDPARGDLITSRLRTLASHTDTFYDWVEASPEHARLFLNDPVTAIKEALPFLPSDFFQGWRAPEERK